MIHPNIYVKFTEKGFGVFAKSKIAKGQVLWILDNQDIRMPLQEYSSIKENMLQKLNIYSYKDSSSFVIIPWDEGKYVNHSCEPNSIGLFEYDNVSVALRDIDADEEIVEDYDAYYGHFEKFSCLCGSEKCRKTVGLSLSPEEIQKGRLKLETILDEILSQNQPLLQIDSEGSLAFTKLLHEYQSVRLND
jgi:hypothetical protein